VVELLSPVRIPEVARRADDPRHGLSGRHPAAGDDCDGDRLWVALLIADDRPPRST
jgi:hypothetical protein